MNNLVFCCQCRLAFRSVWQELILKNEDKFNDVYKETDVWVKNMENSSESQRKTRRENLIVSNYSKVITDFFSTGSKKIPLKCPNDYKITNNNQVCKYKFLWQSRCGMCILKSISPLVSKIPGFRSNSNNQALIIFKNKDLNSRICGEILASFNGKSLSSSQVQVTKGTSKPRSIPLHVDRDVDIPIVKSRPIVYHIPNSGDVFKIQKIYNLLKQVHQDQIDTSFYLSGIFENATYYCSRATNPLELISVESSFMKYCALSSNKMQKNCEQKMKHLRGQYADLLTLPKYCGNFWRIFRKLKKFWRIFEKFGAFFRILSIFGAFLGQKRINP